MNTSVTAQFGSSGAQGEPDSQFCIYCKIWMSKPCHSKECPLYALSGQMTEQAAAASILALYAARDYIGEDNNPRSNRVLQRIKSALDALASTPSPGGTVDQKTHFSLLEEHMALKDDIERHLEKVAHLESLVERLIGSVQSFLVEQDGEEHDDGCELCDGCGEISATTTRSDRDQIGCPACIERAHSRTVRSALPSTSCTQDDGGERT